MDLRFTLSLMIILPFLSVLNHRLLIVSLSLMKKTLSLMISLPFLSVLNYRLHIVILSLMKKKNSFSHDDLFFIQGAKSWRIECSEASKDSSQIQREERGGMWRLERGGVTVM